MHFDQKSFGKKIRQLRVARNMSQEELAEKVNTERSYIAKIETGIRVCSIDLIVDFSDVFQVSTDYLLLEANKGGNMKEELMIVAEKLLEIVKRL